MTKVGTVAFREFLETVRTKAFFISVVLVPALIMVFVFGAEWIEGITGQETLPPRRIALLDESGLLAEKLQEQIEQHNAENPKRPFVLEPQPADVDLDALVAAVRAGELYAYLRITADVINADAACELGRKDQQLQAGRLLEGAVNAAVVAVRFEQSDPPLDQEYVARLQRKVPVETIDVRTGQAGRDDAFVRLLTPFAFMFLLFMGTMQISYGLLTSLLEEKSTRVIEVLLSAVSPFQLMAGKIIGVVMVGLLLLCVWGGVGYYSAHSRGYSYLISAQMIAYVLLYFVPGFLLISATLGAIGSACNTLKEAQSMASPITIVTIVPMVLWLPISQNPESTFALVLSYVPPITPFIMVLRLCSNPDIPLWQVLSTQAVLWAAIVATIWAAGKIFRVGVLMYGKPPSLKELLRWVRYA